MKTHRSTGHRLLWLPFAFAAILVIAGCRSTASSTSAAVPAASHSVVSASACPSGMSPDSNGVCNPSGVTPPSPTDTPAAPAVIGTWSGHGNQVTPAFTVPDSGNYIVAWTYHGNTSNDGFGAMADNFIIDNTGDGIGMGLPNDIASHGSGTTEVTSGTGTDRFNVQADPGCSWTVTVTASS